MLLKEIFEYEDILVKIKLEGEDIIRYIDDILDEIRKELIELRNKIVNYVDVLLEDYLLELV